MGDVLGAHGRGDQRNIYVIENGQLEELTPHEDSEQAARQLARAVGARFYFRRSARGDEFGWAAYPVDVAALPAPMKPKWFPTRDAAIMYASMKMGG